MEIIPEQKLKIPYGRAKLRKDSSNLVALADRLRGET